MATAALADQTRSLYRQLLSNLHAAPLREPARLVGLALGVGVVGGLGALVFRWMIAVARFFFVRFLLGPGLGSPAGIEPYLKILAPALGLSVVAFITTRFAREVRGHGVPQILEALALRGGRIRPRVGFFGILAPAITIGAEGSVGREGPIALIGAAFGSTLGQVLKLPDEQISLLLACGSAAGIGATFNAPIAGALFGLEVVLGSYAMGALVPCFIASVAGVTVFDWIHGAAPVLRTPPWTFAHGFGVAAMLILGLMAGGVGLLYTRGLNLVERLNEQIPVGPYTKAIVGGLAVGLVGFALPQVLGVGYATMRAAAYGQVGLGLLLALLVGKYVATLLTIGAGGSGGVFAPSLFLGATLGGAFGAVAHALAPGATSVGPLYAVAGMGAVFAASAQAPLTAVTIILEMTGDYHLVTGVMAACGISYLLYGSLARDSMYTVRLARRGIQILRGAEVRPLQGMSVTAAMDRDPLVLAPGEPLRRALEAMANREVAVAVVVDDQHRFLGVVDEPRVLDALHAGEAPATVGELARVDVPTLAPTASLDDAMRRFGLYNVTLIPILEPDTRHLVGTLTRDAVMQAYYRRTILTLEMNRKLDLVREDGGEARPGQFRELILPADWGPGKGGARLSDIGSRLPPGVVVVAITRGDQEVAARGTTELKPLDRVLVYATDREQLQAAEGTLLAGEVVEPERRGQFAEVTLPPAHMDDPPRRVRDLDIPRGVLLVSVRHEHQTVVPSGDTRIDPGDSVLLYALDPDLLEQATRRLVQGEGDAAP